MNEIAALPKIPERRRRPIGDERRDAILAALENLLRERSFAQISVGDIASAAGMGRSGFYFYFASKGAAVTAILGEVFAKLQAGAARFSTEGPTTEMIRAAMWAGWEASWEYRGLFLAMLDARSTDPSVRELWEAWIERFVTILSALLDQQRESGQAALGPGSRELLEALLGANERTFERLCRSGANSEQATAAVESLVAIWSRTIYGTYEPPGSLVLREES